MLSNEHDIDSLFDLAKKAVSGCMVRDAIIADNNLEIEKLLCKIELAETFTNTDLQKTIREQQTQIENLEKKLKIATANQRLLLEAFDSKKKEIEKISLQNDTTRVIKKIEKAVQEHELKSNKTIIHNHFYGKTYNSFGNLNKD
jgi:hypothetical protein